MGVLSGCGGSDPDPSAETGDGDGDGDGDSNTERVACEDDSECSDGNACNGVETCEDGLCAPGEEVDCNDGIDCKFCHSYVARSIHPGLPRVVVDDRISGGR